MSKLTNLYINMLKYVLGSACVGSFADNVENEISTRSHVQGNLFCSEVSRFADGEMHLRIPGIESWYGDQFLHMQSICSPVNDNFMELLMMINIASNAGSTFNAVFVPYFGYARQDRMMTCDDAVTAEVVSRTLAATNLDRIAILDVHSEALLNYFPQGVAHNVSSKWMFKAALCDHRISPVADPKLYSDESKTIVVAPDAGAAKRAQSFAGILYNSVEIAVINKHRPSAGASKVMNVIGDVKDKVCIIKDDIIDSGGTLMNAAVALKDAGATKVIACITHPVMKGFGNGPITDATMGVLKAIDESSIDHLLVSDSIGSGHNLSQYSKKIIQIKIWSVYCDSIHKLIGHELMISPALIRR